MSPPLPLVLSFVVVQWLSRVWRNSMDYSMPDSRPSLSPGVCSSSCPLYWLMPSIHLILCHPLLLLPSIFPSIRVFSNELTVPIRWSNYWCFSPRSVLPMNIQGLFPLGLTSLISLYSKRLSKVFSSTTIQKHQFFGTPPSLSYKDNA